MTGPGAHLRRLDCVNIYTLSHVQSHSFQVDTNERPHVKRGWSVIWRMQVRPSENMQLQWGHHIGEVFES